jgi:hypothetical protein
VQIVTAPRPIYRSRKLRQQTRRNELLQPPMTKTLGVDKKSSQEGDQQ